MVSVMFAPVRALLLCWVTTGVWPAPGIAASKVRIAEKNNHTSPCREPLNTLSITRRRPLIRQPLANLQFVSNFRPGRTALRTSGELRLDATVELGNSQRPCSAHTPLGSQCTRAAKVYRGTANESN